MVEMVSPPGLMLFRQPGKFEIMRYAAWERQQEALQVCSGMQMRTKHCIVASHYTAAALLGVPVPKRKPGRSFLVVRHKKDRIRLKNVSCRYWKNLDIPGDLIDMGDFQCVSPEALFVQMSMELSLEQLIIFGDSLICRDRRLRLTTIRNIRHFIMLCDRCRGIRKCIKALFRMCEGTDSPQETKLRLDLIRYGLPNPRVNHLLNNNYIDLSYPESKIGIEYDGLHHLGQISKDHERANGIQAEGWHILTVDKYITRNWASFIKFIINLYDLLCMRNTSKISLLRIPLSVPQICDRRRRL